MFGRMIKPQLQNPPPRTEAFLEALKQFTPQFSKTWDTVAPAVSFPLTLVRTPVHTLSHTPPLYLSLQLPLCLSLSLGLSLCLSLSLSLSPHTHTHALSLSLSLSHSLFRSRGRLLDMLLNA